MQIAMFTKLFRGQTLDRMAEHIAACGFRDVDLLIRDGHQATPSTPTGIAPAVRTLASHGLGVPMATTDMTAATTEAEAVFASCAGAGIRDIRLGYYRYAGSAYRQSVDAARRDLDGLEALAGKCGVRLLLQLHGGTIHASGGQTALLLEGRDPTRVAAYPDPGNQVVQDGRDDWRFTFDVLAPWVACVGVKNGGWMPGVANETGQRVWRSDWFGLADGMVRWDEIIAHLRRTAFAGVLTLHSHYEVPLGIALAQTRTDLAYVQALLAREP